MEKIYHCPYCKDIKITGKSGARLFVNEEKQLWFCFKCNKGGHLREVEHLLTTPVYIKHGSVTQRDEGYKKYSSLPTLVTTSFYPYYYDEKIREYVESRIPRLGALRLDLKTDGTNVVFQRDTFYQVRYLNGDKKYISYGEIEPTVISTHRNNVLIVVEGFFDAGFICRQWNTLITFGCKKFPNLMEIISKYDPIVIAYDKDWWASGDVIGCESILKTLNKKYYFYKPKEKDICLDGYLAVRKIRELVG